MGVPNKLLSDLREAAETANVVTAFVGGTDSFYFILSEKARKGLKMRGNASEEEAQAAREAVKEIAARGATRVVAGKHDGAKKFDPRNLHRVRGANKRRSTSYINRAYEAWYPAE